MTFRSFNERLVLTRGTPTVRFRPLPLGVNVRTKCAFVLLMQSLPSSFVDSLSGLVVPNFGVEMPPWNGDYAAGSDDVWT
jgi:hypothetical protein